MGSKPPEAVRGSRRLRLCDTAEAAKGDIMFTQYLFAALAGLACGVVNGGYLLLVLYATAAARGIWRNLLVATWPVHVLGSIFLVIFVVSHPIWARGAPVGLYFIFPYVLLTGGAMLWYMQTHPNPLRFRR